VAAQRPRSGEEGNDPALGRFAQADTIIPNNIQGLDRYAYANNNPLYYTDPTGHVAIGDSNEAGCSGGGPACIIDMWGDYDNEDKMMDSLRSWVRHHKDYDPVSDPKLSDEEKAVVSIAMFHVAVQDAPEDASIWDILKAAGPSAAMVTIFGIITEGFNMSPDDNGGGGGNYSSTGRTTPRNLTEKLAMEAVMSNPNAGVVLPITMKDPRWPASEGWVKMAQNVNGVEIHYVHNTKTGLFADFKFP
jgi:hypothetical protein